MNRVKGNVVMYGDGRWQYKTTPKPRVTIRRSDEGPGVENSTPQGLGFETRPEGGDQEQQGSDLRDSQDLDNLVPTEQAWPLETIKVEISTPAEFKNTYYEIATIKSPYTFQVSVRSKHNIGRAIKTNKMLEKNYG